MGWKSKLRNVKYNCNLLKAYETTNLYDNQLLSMIVHLGTVM